MRDWEQLIRALFSKAAPQSSRDHSVFSSDSRSGSESLSWQLPSGQPTDTQSLLDQAAAPLGNPCRSFASALTAADEAASQQQPVQGTAQPCSPMQIAEHNDKQLIGQSLPLRAVMTSPADSDTQPQHLPGIMPRAPAAGRANSQLGTDPLQSSSAADCDDAVAAAAGACSKHQHQPAAALQHKHANAAGVDLSSRHQHQHQPAAALQRTHANTAGVDLSGRHQPAVRGVTARNQAAVAAHQARLAALHHKGQHGQIQGLGSGKGTDFAEPAAAQHANLPANALQQLDDPKRQLDAPNSPGFSGRQEQSVLGDDSRVAAMTSPAKPWGMDLGPCNMLGDPALQPGCHASGRAAPGKLSVDR